jgi:hypothetical protein
VNWKEDKTKRTVWRTRFGRGYGSVAKQMHNDYGDDDDDGNNNNNNNSF